MIIKPELTPEQTLEALENERAVKVAKREAERKAAGVSQAIVDTQALSAAEEEHGESYVLGEEDEGDAYKLCVVKTASGIVILKTPAGVVHKRFRASKHTDTDETKYVLACLVHPSPERLTDMIDMHRGLLDRCVKAACELAGVRFKEILGK